MVVKGVAPEMATEDFWYDLFYGGYIRTADFLEYEEDIEQVEKAVEVLQKFREALFFSQKITEM